MLSDTWEFRAILCVKNTTLAHPHPVTGTSPLVEEIDGVFVGYERRWIQQAVGLNSTWNGLIRENFAARMDSVLFAPTGSAATVLCTPCNDLVG